MCSIENSAPLQLCAGYDDLSATDKAKCCGAIYDLGTPALVPRKERVMALNGSDFAYSETERSTSGNGQNIYDKMEFFMQIGCLCIEDIYEFDTEFFDEVVSAAADCATTTAGATKSTVLVPTSMGSGFGGCPNLNTLYNGFADLNQETMRESVDAMPKTYSPPPPPLATLAPRDDFRLDVWIPGYDVADVKTHNEKSSLEFALETALNMSAGLEVEILDVYRGAPINLTSENSTDSTILKIKVVSTAGTELTSSQLHGIHDKVMDNMGKAKYDKGFNLGATYGWAEITSPTQIDGTIPMALTRQDVPETPPASDAPRKLPAASTGLPRQGLSVRGRFRGHQHGLHAVPRRSGFPGHRYGHPPGCRDDPHDRLTRRHLRDALQCCNGAYSPASSPTGTSRSTRSLSSCSSRSPPPVPSSSSRRAPR